MSARERLQQLFRSDTFQEIGGRVTYQCTASGMTASHVAGDAAIAGTGLVMSVNAGGARIQEGVDALPGYGRVFWRNVDLSSVVAQIAMIAGLCAGGAAYALGLMDWIIMSRENARLFLAGPQVVKSAAGRGRSCFGCWIGAGFSKFTVGSQRHHCRL